MMLLDHICRLIEGASRHKLPDERCALPLERRQVYRPMRFDDRADFALRLDNLYHILPVLLCIVQTKDVAHCRKAQLFELGSKCLMVIDDMIGAVFSGPLSAFWTRGGADDGETSPFCKLCGNRANAARSANNQNALAL